MYKEELDIIVKYLKKDLWEIEQDIIVILKTDNKPYVIPKGFITDFASIPKIFWSILPPFGKYSLASIIHDHMYRINYNNRKFADEEFLLQMKHNGVHYIIRNIMYLTVRCFGSSRW